MPSKFSSRQEVTRHIDAEGNITEDVKETLYRVEHSNEPDYIKIYTKMWCEFNEVPPVFRELFFQLAVRMTYCNADNLGEAQIVATGSPIRETIMKALGWTSRSMYQKGIAALCECDAIRKVGRGMYQVNPMYFAKGEWKYNPRLQRGGVEDLIAVFSFKDKKVVSDIIWADDGEPSELNEMFREGLGVRASDGTILKKTTVTM